ncbi:phosphoglycolate phosphatase [Undibacterium sp. 14-3-2]|uniref:phosphoglycolate phosphatase n=1 Tax=Undibacterium sp. 14-3-2 TaxID=2800129 RepID=UPI0019041022|nr:phosphoglycolate phosphatase [Undibacterium sp. 14-3-2]MBK1889949.1 phosphoglycolate phosphatase [Undibacterium sp. 14-3-2]
MFNNINAVIIDLDGTMLDTAPDFLVAINRMRNDFSLSPLTLDLVKSMVGKGSENLITRVLSLDFDEAGVQQHFAQGMASYQRHYLDINGDHSTLYPEVIEGLQAMQTMRLRLACVTNKPLAFAIPLMQKKGLSSYFELTFGGDSFTRKKPDPQPLLEVSKQFGIAPSHILAIGDSSNDAIAARAAGCPVLTVPYGYNHGEAVQTIQSDGIVGTLLEAARLLATENQH